MNGKQFAFVVAVIVFFCCLLLSSLVGGGEGSTSGAVATRPTLPAGTLTYEAFVPFIIQSGIGPTPTYRPTLGVE